MRTSPFLDQGRLWQRIVIAISATLVVACGGPGGAKDGGTDPQAVAPPPYVGSLADAPECELSADCPSGTYCDLGQCFQACNQVDPCTGELVCLARGRCDASPDAPADVPLQTTVGTTLSSAEPAIHLGPEDMVATIEVSSSNLDEEVRYRIDSEVPWLRVQENRGTFSGNLTKMLIVDRSQLVPGDYSGTVIVRTTQGNVHIPVTLEQSLTAVYSGAVNYEAPRDLGQTYLRFELRESNGYAAIRVDSERSPLFPELDLGGDASPDDLMTTAVIEDGRVEGTITQVFRPSDLGADALFDRTIAREMTFSLEVQSSGGLTGTFSERWIGLFPSAVTVTGRIYLGRENGPVVGEFAPGLPPMLPPNGSPNPPPIPAGCTSVGDTLATLPVGTCDAGGSASQLNACGEAMVERGAPIDDPSVGLVVGNALRGYNDFEDECATDWPVGSVVPAPSSAVVGCVQRGNLACSLRLHGSASALGSTDGVVGVHHAVSGYAAAALFLTNAELVDAFRVPYHSPSGADLPALTLTELANANAYARNGLREIMNLHTLHVLRTTSPTVAASVDHIGVRRLVQLVGRYRQSADEALAIDLRRGPDITTPEAVRSRTWRLGINTLASLVALGEIANTEQIPDLPESALFSEAITRTSRVFLESHGDSPLFGVPEGFVPFIFDPQRPEPTNFEQNLAQANAAIDAAVAKETIAENSTRAFDEQVATLTSELNNLNSEHRTRLISLCGALPGMPSQPNVAGCGASTGQLAIARGNFQAAQQEILIAQQRIEDLASRVEVQDQRIRRISGIQLEFIQFTTRNGNRINALDLKSAQLSLVKEVLQTVASGSFINPGAYVAATGIAAIGMVQIDVQSRRQQLAQAQELEALQVNREVDYVNGMAAIKDMLISSSELNLQVALAVTRAQTAGIEIATIEQEVATQQAEYALNVARVTDTTRPLANNPAFRVLRDDAIVEASRHRDEAIRMTYLAALAFEFETNADLPAIGAILLPALRATDVDDFATTCLSGQFASFRQMYGSRQTFVDEISLREDVLGIRGPITDPVSGAVVTEAEQFRQLLLTSSNIAFNGVVTLEFATGVGANNGLFSNSVCNDQVRSIQVKLIGDGLGDNQARVHLEQRGTAFQRSCTAFRNGEGERVFEYVIPDAQQNYAVIQAGVNAYPESSADTQLFGRAVGASQWRISIPPGATVNNAVGPVEPTNADVSLVQIEDIVIRVEHSAISINPAGPVFAPLCQ